jgi:hypothetical protein
MAGSITVSSITLDADNNFSIRSNTGATLFSLDGTGVISGVANTALSNKSIANPTISGNLSFDSTGTTGVRSPAANTLTFHTSGTEDVRIDANGNVGIGTSSPAYPLDIRKDSGAWEILKIQNSFGTESALIRAIGASGGSVDFGALGSSANTYIVRTNSTERMRIDGSGRVTKPFQPAFLAYASSNKSLDSATVTFTTVNDATVFNVGSNYNTGNGRFTAPVSGVYSFSGYFSTSVNPGPRLETKLFLNGLEVARFYGYSDNNTTVSSGIDSLIYLNAGDYVQIGKYSDNATTLIGDTTRITAFSGYLVG